MAGVKRGFELPNETTGGKNTKRKTSLFGSHETVEIRIEGHEDEPFCVHTSILAAYSDDFKLIFAASENGKRQLTIKNLSFEMFDAFVKWMYATYPEDSSWHPLELAATDEVDTVSDDEDGNVDGVRAAKPAPKHQNHNAASRTDQKKFMASTTWLRRPTSETPSSDAKCEVEVPTTTGGQQSGPSVDKDVVMPSRKSFSRRHRVFLDLVDLYIFTVRYDVSRYFRDTVVLMVQSLVARWKLLPHYFVVKHALNNLASGAPLCSFFAACCAFYSEIPSKFFRDLPCDFLAEVLELIATKSRAQSDKAIKSEIGYWCVFHEHRNGDDIDICIDTRDRWIDSRDDFDLFLAAQTEVEVRPSKTKKRDEAHTTSTSKAKEDKVGPNCAHTLAPKPPSAYGESTK